MLWQVSYRADPRALPLADRHYNRQKVGSAQFVPPGRCVVLISRGIDAVWTTSWPIAGYVQHNWAGAWVNSLFRSEQRAVAASDLIHQAVAATRAFWAPPLGIVSFVDPTAVPGILRHGERIYGYCYLKAGWKHVGFTKGALWVWQQLPADMPAPMKPYSPQMTLAL